MRSAASQTTRTSVDLPWQVEALRLLDEQHLCVWSDDAGVRREVVDGLAAHVRQITDAAVGVIEGAGVHDVRTFAAALARALGAHPDRGDVDDPDLLFRLLRRSPEEAGGAPGNRPAVKRRVLLWSDAHELLARDPRLFGRLADTLIGSALESELMGEDLLLIQRVVFVGRAALDVYREDPSGQFRAWFSEDGETPLWRSVTGVTGPRVGSVRAETLLAGRQPGRA